MSGKTLLCRCEDVTLDEVEHAIAKGHTDIESVKRFTGFATGWCQGKQCLIACARVIEDKTGAFPLAPITPRPPVHPMPLGMLAGLANVVSTERVTHHERGGVRKRTEGNGEGESQ